MPAPVPMLRPLPLTTAIVLSLALMSASIDLYASDSASSAAASATGGTVGDSGYDPFSEFDDPPTRPSNAGAAAGENAYRDRIIAPSALAALPIDEDDDSDSSGPPRGAHVELVAHRTRFAGERQVEFGAAFSGFWDTDDFGTLSGDGVLFRSDRARAEGRRWQGSGTLWQRNLPMPGGWTANNGIGVLNTPMPSLLRDQYRFFLPSVPMLGASSEWQQPSRGLQWQLAAGRGGTYDGARLSGFDYGDGAVGTVGAQWAWSQRWHGAASLLITDGRIVADERGLPDFRNGRTRALLFGNRWQGARDTLTANVLASEHGRDRR